LTGTETEDQPARVSRRKWQALQHFSAFGTRFVLRSNRDAVLPTLLTRLPLGSSLISADGACKPHHAYSIVFAPESDFSATINRDGRRIATCSSQADLVNVFSNEVTNQIAKSARDRVVIHCGVVAWQGKAILIPGRSTHGKTTLVTRFLEAGATYYSDEFALLDGDGLVHPYARPLQVRMQKGSLVQTQVPAEQIRGLGGIGKDPASASMLLACRFREGARWRPVEISRGAAALELTRHCTSANRFPQNAFHATTQAVSQLRAWRGWRGEGKDVVEWALNLLDAEV